MKKIILLTSLALVAIASTSTFCNGSNPEKSKKAEEKKLFGHEKKASFGLPGEDTINLSYDFVLPSMITIDTNDAKQDIQIGLGPVVTPISPLTRLILKKSNMETLYTMAKNLHQAGNYITAVEIFYGYSDSTKSLSYYFLPVCLQDANPGTPPTTNTYRPTSGPSPSTGSVFYVYNSLLGVLMPANNKQLQDTTNYMSKIAITHYLTASPTPFSWSSNSSSNSNADTKYVIFPFQEIFHMYQQNNIDSLTLYNVAIPVSVSGEYYTKHGLLLVPFTPPGGGAGNRFTVDEDLGHMVPPDYPNITYVISQ